MRPHNKDEFFLVQEVTEVEFCGNTFFQFLGSEFRKPTDFIRNTYKDHNLNTCEQCRNNHARTIRELTEKFKKFPNCCLFHRKLLKAPWFDRKDFENVPRWYADKLFYTWHHILHFTDLPNWKIEILDFIEYIFQTFGNFPLDYGEPLYFKGFTDELKDLIKNIEDSDKSKVIINYISEISNHSRKPETDINILMKTYDKWYKTFPFELSFFSHLRQHFKETTPFINEVRTNKYLGITTAKLITKDRLIEILVGMTEKIVTEINILTLYEQGKIKNIDQIGLELIIQERKQKLKQGYHSEVRDPDTKYRKILKQWLKDEIEFTKKLTDWSGRSAPKEIDIHDKVINACCKMQENMTFWTADENTRTRQILDLLSSFLFTKDQSLYGESATGKRQGSVDGVMVDKNGTEYFIEAFNLASLDRSLIQSHITKLEKNYDSKGLRIKYILIYCNVVDGKFGTLYRDYCNYLSAHFDKIISSGKGICTRNFK